MNDDEPAEISIKDLSYSSPPITGGLGINIDLWWYDGRVFSSEEQVVRYKQMRYLED